MFRIQLVVSLLIICLACNTEPDKLNDGAELHSSFAGFQQTFLDSFWKNNPANAIHVGYGKYYERLKVPDSIAFSKDVAFAKTWLDSLEEYDYNNLNGDDKINYNIIRNKLQSNIWYIDTFKAWQWNPAQYNIGSECNGIINQSDLSLNNKLSTLSKHLQNSDAYYNAAKKNITHPTKEHTELAIQQNNGALQVFGASLMDSISVATLNAAEKDTLLYRIKATKAAINNYVSFLTNKLADSAAQYRDFRIGKELYKTKFNYDLVTDISPEDLYAKAIEAKKNYHKEMYRIANELWPKYGANLSKPGDSLQLIKTVIDKVSLQHVSPKNLMDTIKSQVSRLQTFIIQKDL